MLRVYHSNMVEHTKQHSLPFLNYLHNADSLKILESWTDPGHLATTFAMQKSGPHTICNILKKMSPMK